MTGGSRRSEQPGSGAVLAEFCPAANAHPPLPDRESENPIPTVTASSPPTPAAGSAFPRPSARAGSGAAAPGASWANPTRRSRPPPSRRPRPGQVYSVAAPQPGAAARSRQTRGSGSARQWEEKGQKN
ncbi:uncharacterized protein LOC115599865 [Calypte anna]|uniref:uncharacterized protein LOC115599865 n=1 Tax=Calypte anna TaxID=9244 RepID=UPI0011C438DA|nr:uncharacterized protein LOC115599865 [Calypte anna]